MEKMDSGRDPEGKPLRNITISVTAETNVGGRPYMEDFFAVELKANEESQKSPHLRAQAYVGIFDGHGGKEAAKYARDRLWEVIQSQPKFNLRDPEVIKEGLCEAFVTLHQEMEPLRASWKRHKTGELSTAGTTASTVVFRGDHIFVANVGDSTAVLAVSNPEKNLEGQHPVKALRLTKDHKPEDPNEINNIRTLGGSVKKGKKGIARVVWQRERLQSKGVFDGIPFLGVSRSLGDFWSYNPRTRKFTVSPKPDVYVHKINLERHKFLVIASDGLWNVMSPDEVVQFIWDYQNNLPVGDNDNDSQKKKDVVKAIIDKALSKWAGKMYPADNIAVLIAFLSETAPEVTTKVGKHKTALRNGPIAVNGGTDTSKVEVKENGEVICRLHSDSLESDGVCGDSIQHAGVEGDSSVNHGAIGKSGGICFKAYYNGATNGSSKDSGYSNNSKSDSEDIFFDAVSDLSDLKTNVATSDGTCDKSVLDSSKLIKRSDTLPVKDPSMNLVSVGHQERSQQIRLGKRQTTEEVHPVAASMDEDSIERHERPQRFRLGKRQSTEEVCENAREECPTVPKLHCPGVPMLKRCGRNNGMEIFSQETDGMKEEVDEAVRQENGIDSTVVLENGESEHKLDRRSFTPPVEDVPACIEDSIDSQESPRRIKLGKRRSTEEVCATLPMLKRSKAFYCPSAIVDRMEEDQDSGVHCDDPAGLEEDTPTADVAMAADGGAVSAS